MAKFNKLDVPYQWKDEFTKYPHGYTIFEALCKWVKQVDEMVDNVNDWNEYLDNFVETFEFELQKEVQSTIEKWQNEGLLDGIIESALNTELDNVKTQLAQIAINVKSYGAKGDGVTDDTESIRAAAELGEPLLIPDGTYKISGTIPIKNSVYFHGKLVMEGTNGDGTHTAILVKDTEDKPILIKNPQIDLGWDGITTTGEQDHCISIRGVDNVTIEGGILENAMGDHVYVGGNSELSYKPSKNIVVRNVVMRNSRRTNIALTGVDGVLIEHCELFSNADYVGSVDVEPNGNYHCLNVTIKNNKIKNTLGRGIILHSHATTRKIDGIKIMDNEIDTVRRCIQSTYEPIGRVEIVGNVLRNADECIRINAIAEELIIERNKFTGNTTYYIVSIGTSAHGAKKVIFKDNMLENTSKDLQCLRFERVEQVTITGNTFESFATSSAYAIGVVTIKDVDRCNVIGNYFLNNGAYAIGLTGTLKNVVIVGNTFIPDLNNFLVYTKGGVIVGGTTVIDNLTSENNIYSSNLELNWKIHSGAVIPVNSSEMVRLKTYYGTQPPTTGTFNIGDRTINTNPSVGSPKSWVYTSTGWVSEGNL